MIRDIGETLLGRLIVERIEHDRAMPDVVEQRAGLGVEQRQPMFHARMPPALADRRVERVVVRLPAEGRDIILAEAADRVGGELHLAHGDEVESPQLPHRALRLRIERADRFQRMTEEVEAYRKRHAGCEEVDDTAPHRIFARVAHDIGAEEPVGFEPDREIVGRNRVPGRRREAVGRDTVARRHALEDGAHGRRQDARPLGRGTGTRQAGQHRHAPRRDRRIG